MTGSSWSKADFFYNDCKFPSTATTYLRGISLSSPLPETRLGPSTGGEINWLDPEKWLDEHGDALYAYALRRVREASTAEDLVQETLLTAIKAKDTFRGESTERTWLTGILKHKVLDHFRQAARELPLPEVPPLSDSQQDWFDQSGNWLRWPGDWADPERSLEQDEFWHAMSDCIDRLPDKLRIPYILREFDGVETEELIRTLNISSRNNLWAMLSRARLQLRQCLEIKWFSN